MIPRSLANFLRLSTWPILLAMLALMATGVLAIRASEGADATMRGFSSRQVMFAGVGMVVCEMMTVIA